MIYCTKEIAQVSTETERGETEIAQVSTEIAQVSTDLLERGETSHSIEVQEYPKYSELEIQLLALLLDEEEFTDLEFWDI